MPLSPFQDMSEKVLTSREKRLLIFSTIMRLGHEAFKKPSVDAVYIHILNNSRSLKPYDRAALIDCRSKKPRIVGVMGQSQVNQDSEYCIQLQRLINGFKTLKEPIVIDDEMFARYNVADKSIAAFHEFFSGERVLLLPMKSPEEGDNELFIWVVEFLEETMATKDHTLNYFTLLASHYAEAIWYKLKTSGRNLGIPKSGASLKRFFNLKVMLAILLVLFVTALFLVKVPLQAIADFEFKPVNSHIIYAPYSGTIKQVNFESGQAVKPDKAILEMDTREMMYDLSIAQKRLAEILAELDLVKTQSFNKIEYRGQIKVLDIRRQLEENRIRKYRWFLERSKIHAGNDGTLIIGDKNILTGKKVEAGERLFEVVSEDDIIAEIYLNEKDAAVLGQGVTISLYPHTRPEQPMAASITSISPVPLKLGGNQFNYRIKVKLDHNPQGQFNCGMRGIANLAGKDVPLGYYLFRSLIIWWRKL